MATRVRIWHVSNGFGFAGTERAAETWCRGLDPRRFEVSAFSRLEGGPRLAGLKATLKSAAVIGARREDWARLFERQGCDLLHIHRHGASDSGWDALIREARERGVRVIVETNVFGARDLQGLGMTLDHHFFVSAMCLWRYAGWPKSLPEGFSRRHSVLYNPLRRGDFPSGSKAPAPHPRQKSSVRRLLGIPQGAFVLGRLGRPDINKWPAWLPEAFASFAARHVDAHLLLMSAPESALRELEGLGLRGRFSNIPASPDWKRVSLAYQAMDCLAHGSRVGESFGYTLAEAAAFGLPVVVDSTPWADNAQIEVVDHGETGLVAGRPEAFVASLEALRADPALRLRLGAAAWKKAWARFDSRLLLNELEQTYLALLKGNSPEPQDFVAGFGADYQQRLGQRNLPSFLKDGAWGLWSSLRLYWRSWASRGLKRMGLRS